MRPIEGPVYKAAVIGCGAIASTLEDRVRAVPGVFLFPYSHAGVYVRHPRTVLAAAAELEPERLAAFGQRWGVTALYTDYREMLEREKPDIVSIATSSKAHHEITLETCKYPVKGIFLEKPVARTLQEADEMIAACRGAGIKVAVNHTRTFDPFFRHAKALIDNGEIGELKAVMALWREGFSFGGSHLWDLLRYMVKSDVDWLLCDPDPDPSLRDPGGDAYIVYRNGVRAHVHMPFGTPVPLALTFIANGGRIYMDPYDMSWWKLVEAGGRKLPVQYPFPARTDGKSAMYVAVEELIQAIETGGETASTLEHGRASLEVSVGLLISGQRREPVRFPITDNSFAAEAMW
jgi:predicted dehydrogenase